MCGTPQNNHLIISHRTRTGQHCNMRSVQVGLVTDIYTFNFQNGRRRLICHSVFFDPFPERGTDRLERTSPAGYRIWSRKRLRWRPFEQLLVHVAQCFQGNFGFRLAFLRVNPDFHNLARGRDQPGVPWPPVFYIRKNCGVQTELAPISVENFPRPWPAVIRQGRLVFDYCISVEEIWTAR